MRVLVAAGGGGRDAPLAWKLAHSETGQALLAALAELNSYTFRCPCHSTETRFLTSLRYQRSDSDRWKRPPSI